MRFLSPLSRELSWPRRSFFDDFDRLVNTETFSPSCDIHETNHSYNLSFDVPGIKKDDIKIEINEGQLTVSGERLRETKSDENTSVLRHERVYGRFERTFALPASIDAEKIEAHFEDGVLSVRLPKAEIAKGRTIQIQTKKM